MNEEVQVLDEVKPDATQEQVATQAAATEGEAEDKTPQTEEKLYSKSELEAQIKEAKAKASAKAAAIAERRALRAYAEKLEKMSQPTQTQQSQATDSEPKIESYQDVNAYVKAMVKFERDREKAQESQAKAQEQEKTIQSKTEKIYSEAEKIEGFDRDEFDALPITNVIAQAIIDSDVPAKVMAHLTANPDEVDRIAALSPARQAAEIGKLEAKLSTTKETVKEVKVSKAPAPIEPIGNKGSSTKDPQDMTDSEFAAWRKRQIAQRR